MKLYLAGPMTGIPRFNFPAFDDMAAQLRTVGFVVVSPHEQDDPVVQEAAWASPDGDISKLPPAMEGSDPLLTACKNVRDVHGCDGFALLPGWEKSSGSIHELATATRFRIPVAPAGMWLELGVAGAIRALGL